MKNHYDYKIRSNVCVEGPDFIAIASTTFEAKNFLRLIQSLVREVNRLEAELQAERCKRTCTSSKPAYMSDGKDVFWTEEGRASGSLPGMHHIIFESEGEARDGVQILNHLVKQRDQARDRVAERDKALAQVADIEAMLDEIKDYCSAAHRAASVLRDTIEQGGAK